jgi:phosphatidylglycerophosphatase C
MSDRPGVAAFDFDGTLVPGDSLPRFLARLHGRSRFAEILTRASPAMLLAYGRSGRDGAKAALLARAVAGLDSGQVNAAGEAFAVDLTKRIRPVMAEWIRWHNRKGHRRVLVSASLAVYLEPFGRLAGFEQVIATRLETGPNGRLTGRMDGANVRSEEKAIRLRQILGPDPAELWAYGNSAGDREMLAMADHPMRVGLGGRGLRRP